MKLLRDLAAAARFPGGAVTIGNFDGVHRGHAELIRRLAAGARACGGPAMVFTFDPHPVRLLRPDAAPLPLTWTERKAELLARLGVDVVLAYPTDAALLHLTAQDFVREIIQRGLAARRLVEGPNFRFGRGRSGDVELLSRLCAQANMVLDIVEPLEIGGQMVSSSRVRSALAAGQVDEARLLLTEPYRVRGRVVHGAGRGARIGFPTANLDAIDTMAPGLGVYAGRAVVSGRAFPAAIHVGPNPTFDERRHKIEVHLLGWSEPLYGELLEVDFLSRVRDIHRFDSVEALTVQLQSDVAETLARYQGLEPQPATPRGGCASDQH